MPPFQQRVVEEALDLDTKIGRLKEFAVTTRFEDLAFEEQGRMLRQLTHMNDYSTVLHERIAAFGPVDMPLRGYAEPKLIQGVEF